MSKTVSGVLTLGGRDKKGALELALKYLKYDSSRGATSDAVRKPVDIDIVWVRDIGGPGGVMIRYRTDDRTHQMLKLDAEAVLQPLIDELPSPSAAGRYGGPGGEMPVSVRDAGTAPQYLPRQHSHRLVKVTTTTGNQDNVDERDEALRRYLYQFLAILAHQQIDLAQYERQVYRTNVPQTGTGIDHYMRFYDNFGRGDFWLTHQIQRAAIAAFCLPRSKPIDKLDKMIPWLYIEGVPRAAQGATSADNPATVNLGFFEENYKDFIPTLNFLDSSTEDFPTFVEGRQMALASPVFSGFQAWAFSLHCEDRPGLFVEFLRVLERTDEVFDANTQLQSRVVTACCRGIGREGYHLAVVHLPELPDSKRSQVEAIEQRLLQLGAAPAGSLRPRVDTMRLDGAVGAGVAPIQTPKIISLHADGSPPLLDQLIDITHKLGECDANITFVDMRLRDPGQNMVNCAIAVDHSSAVSYHVREILGL